MKVSSRESAFVPCTNRLRRYEGLIEPKVPASGAAAIGQRYDDALPAVRSANTTGTPRWGGAAGPQTPYGVWGSLLRGQGRVRRPYW
ncbi:hypothetical protein MLGJGCBP_05791 [Rhodococcus sp. T7]|nr:hypothetical protein MLGJGCBP_05791 [Rhodococcus sp. T7]